MLILDLADGPLEFTLIENESTLELKADAVEPAAVDAAFVELCRARRLKSLRLRSRLRALPRAMTTLSWLQSLEIIDPVLPGLPSSIDRLTRLRDLRLETFHLGSLPRTIGKLHRLRTLYLDSHELCGLPASTVDLQELRSLTLLLRRFIYSDWSHSAYFKPRFTQDLGALFLMLSRLPHLSALTLGEPPPDLWYPEVILDRLPREIAGLSALTTLTLSNVRNPLPLPDDVVLPAIRHVHAHGVQFDATPERVQAMFPGADITSGY